MGKKVKIMAKMAKIGENFQNFKSDQKART